MPSQSGYGIGWGALALINAGLAQGKRRSGLFWFVLSLVLGPIATLLIVVLPVPTGEVRPLRRADWVVIGIVVALLALALALLLVSPRLASGAHASLAHP